MSPDIQRGLSGHNFSAILLHMNTIHGYDEIGNEFTQRCKKSKEGIFKLGVLQNYTGEDASDSWAKWDARYPKESMRLMHQDQRYVDWMQFCKENAPMTRVQIIEPSLTKYAEWQLAVFREYQKEKAEKVRLINAELLGGLALPASDLVIFDDESVLQWSYEPDSDGKVDGGTVFDVSKGDDIGYFLALRDNLLKLSVPLV